jgi:hypothetical protein
MERMLKGNSGAEETMASSEIPAAPVKEKSPRSEKIERVLALAKPYFMPAGITLGSLLAVLVMNFWLKRRARYHFPDFDVEPRLGGAHAAGVGAVISFASAAIPPASQRDQVPDYLRRA